MDRGFRSDGGGRILKKDRRQKRRPLRRLAVVLLTAALVGAFVWWDNVSLQTTYTDASFAALPAGFDGCRIVVLSDLQSMEFGTDNCRLLSAVAKAAPEYIFYLGDLVDRDRGRIAGYVETLAKGLAAIAPVYYITGNHEWALGDVPALKKTLTACGVTVLSNQYVLLKRGGDTAVLAGIDDPNGNADQKTPETLAAEIYAQQGDPFWILLAHRNNRFASEYSRLGADLVFSGHGHGGIIRLPFTDGLLSTDRTFFPSYTAGLYEKNGSALFVTRGLGSSSPFVRLFNRPEVAVVTLRQG